jgi:hypothetical protein
MSRSRWGGFRKGRSRYQQWWNTLRTPEAETESIAAPTETTGFDYTTAQGIWNLNSTVQFYKGNTPPETPAGGDTGGDTGGGGGGATLAFEGYASNTSFSGNGYTINFSSLTGGGVASSGDLAILIVGIAPYYDRKFDTISQEVSSSGWTLLQGPLNAVDVRGSGARVYYKTLGAGETSVSIANATGKSGYLYGPNYASSGGFVLVFSDSSNSPSSVATNERSNTSQPNFGSYSGLTSGNFILDWAASGSGHGGSGTFTSSDYDTVASVAANNASDITVGIGVKQVSSSTFSGTLTHSVDATAHSTVYGQIVIS